MTPLQTKNTAVIDLRAFSAHYCSTTTVLPLRDNAMQLYYRSFTIGACQPLRLTPD